MVTICILFLNFEITPQTPFFPMAYCNAQNQYNDHLTLDFAYGKTLSH